MGDEEMRLRFPTVLTVLLIVVSLLFLPCQALDPSEPSRPPGLPSVQPPPVGSSPSDIPPLSGPSDQSAYEKTEVTFDLPAGWSIFSFPVARVLKTSGFAKCLYFYRYGMYYTVDPLNSPQTIDTRFAYLAHADRPAKITVTGIVNKGMVRSMALSHGWNLLGCPFNVPVPINKIYVDYKSVVKSFAQAASPTLDEGDYWLSSGGYLSDTVEYPVNLLSADASLVPMKGMWIYAWHSVTFVAAGRGSGAASTPRVISVTPQSAAAGSTVEIQGSGFGKNGGFVSIGTTPIPAECVMSWGDSSVQARIPPYVQSGGLKVFANRVPSNEVPITILESPQKEASSTLMGKVQTSDGNPVGGVLLALDSGLSTKSGGDGSYVIPNAPPGSHTIYISRSGYRTAQGKVNLEAGGTDSVLITLTPTAAADGVSGVNGAQPSQPPPAEQPTAEKAAPTEAKPKKGYLNIVADAYDDGYHRWWVRKIDVVEWGNGNYHWYKDWWTDNGDAWYEMDCNGARVGQTYEVRILWLSKDGGRELSNKWYRKVYSTNQTETFESPF